MQTKTVNDWGSNTLQACKDIMEASRNGIDILLHEGKFDPVNERHIHTISNACVDCGVEVVIKGITDPGVVYPHITFIEE